MDLMPWDEKYSVGISEIDEQHKKLFEGINSLFGAMKQGKSNEAISDILVFLVEYAEIHFSTEEKYMLEFKFDEYAHHKKEHDNFNKKVIEFFAKFKEGETMLTSEVVMFLRDWIYDHIDGVDREYMPLFHAKGLD